MEGRWAEALFYIPLPLGVTLTIHSNVYIRIHPDIHPDVTHTIRYVVGVGRVGGVVVRGGTGGVMRGMVGRRRDGARDCECERKVVGLVAVAVGLVVVVLVLIVELVLGV